MTTKMNSFLTEIQHDKIPQDVLNAAASVVMSHCIAAMFLIKNQSHELTDKHFLRMLPYIEKNRSNVAFSSMESSASEEAVTDTIELSANTSEEVMDYILRHLDSPRKSEFSLVKHVIEYLNSDSNFMGIVTSVTNNGIPNHISITMDHISKDEPLSIAVEVDNTQVQRFSNFMPIYAYKSGVGGIGRKELEDDFGFKSHTEMIERIFGVDIAGGGRVYSETCNNKGNPSVSSVEEATRNLYDDTTRKINEGLKGVYDNTMFDYKQKLILSMLGSCYGLTTGRDCTCIVLSSTGKTPIGFNAKDLCESLYTEELSAVCSETSNPSIKILNGAGKELFQLRLKKEKYETNITGHRYKMYFKPNKRLDKLPNKKE